ncbi:hypothetical protein PR202_gb06580 [Eleusine coracana subsp. coracana]|uniref:Uncharacterized protein n=1 Tax=Eleusine coracana subsp. coracana TaxID=191504 RepID=A0AAV5EA04_ELECO|nr:hypothetical protein PR202_gb06580 [Eleusine coracana subsp. coracana]
MLPLASSFGGKILLATNCNEVFSYDPDGNSVERIFAMQEFVDDPVTVKPELLLNIALHEESITGVHHHRRSTTGVNATQLKMKLGSSTVARRQGAAYQHRNDFSVTPQLLHTLIGIAAEEYLHRYNMHN